MSAFSLPRRWTALFDISSSGHTFLFAIEGLRRSDEEAPVAEIRQAHDDGIWALAWHPVGHLIASGSGDKNIKFWIRSRPGEAAGDGSEVSDPRKWFRE